MEVGISIDDFGTGHTSLAYMKDLSASEVKIDQSFVRTSADSPRDAAFVRAAVELGHSLGMQVVAEGVETPEVLRVLSDGRLRPRAGTSDPACRPGRRAGGLVAQFAHLVADPAATRSRAYLELEGVRQVIIVFACVVVVAIEAVVLRGRLARLSTLRFRRIYLVWLALLDQVLVISVLPGHQHLVLDIANLLSYVAAGDVRLVQPKDPRRPARRRGWGAEPRRDRGERWHDAGERVGTRRFGMASRNRVTSPTRRSSPIRSSPSLGDIFATPRWFPAHDVFSIGDVLIVVAVGVLVYRTCSKVPATRPPDPHQQTQSLESEQENKQLDITIKQLDITNKQQQVSAAENATASPAR